MKKAKRLVVIGKGDLTRAHSFPFLTDKTRIELFIEELIQALGMTPMGKPVVYEVDNAELYEDLEAGELGVGEDLEFIDPGGLTCTQVLTTSHVAIHTFPSLQGRFDLDIFSCKAFDIGPVKDLIRLTFPLHQIKMANLTFAAEWDEIEGPGPEADPNQRTFSF